MSARKQYFARPVSAALIWVAAFPALGAEQGPAGEAGSVRVVEGISAPALRALVVETLERNPAVAAAEARAMAASEIAPQVRALPNPTASLTGFLASPETRTGPQRIAVALSQAIPWPGKRALAERKALDQATSLWAEVEARRLELVTQVRRIFHELQYLDRRREIAEDLRDHLIQHEEIARSRYSTGAGSGQGVVKLHAEITLAEKDLLEIRGHRVALEARLNALRDRPALTPVLAEGTLSMPPIEEIPLELETLLERGLASRPEGLGAEARLRRTGSGIELARRSRRPDFRLGLTFTSVDPREDQLGRLQPPEGNGDDILGVMGGISLPVWRRKSTAELEEALEREAAAREDLRATRAAIAAEIGDLAQRLELDWRHVRLVEDLLVPQAEESEESALAGYIAGTLDALSLLDAEHVRFEAHTARARAHANYLIRIAELEGAVGGSLEQEMEVHQP